MALKSVCCITLLESVHPYDRMDGARRNGARLVAVSPLDAELLPADLLARLPYQEHPRNVALVLALAEHFGVDHELALVEIADKLVADLGVLKTYPRAEHRARNNQALASN